MGLPAVAATLEAWHVLDLGDRSFTYFKPLLETNLEAPMRHAYAYGFGFSYVYSRTAWILTPFADVEWSEDGDFTSSLMERGKAVRLVDLRAAASHVDVDAL